MYLVRAGKEFEVTSEIDLNRSQSQEGFPLFTYVFYMFYPKDFTFVCPTEVMELDGLVKEFHKADCAAYAVSSDSPFCHKAWLETPTTIGGLGGMATDVTLVADEDFSLANIFNAKDPNKAQMKRVSVLFNRETQQVVYYAMNPDDVGRDLKDVLRVVQSLANLKDKPDHYCPRKSLKALRKEFGS